MERLRSAKTVAVRQGPAATLEALYRAEYVGMVRLAFTLIGNNAEAEEIVQESFVDLSFRLEDPDTRVREPGAYLRTIVVGRCRSLIRRRRVMQQHPPQPPTDLPASAEPLWDVLQRCVQRPFPTARLTPQMVVGFTDARVYRQMGAVAYGAGLFSPHLDGGDFSRRFHGNDERIDVESLGLTTQLWVDVAHGLWT